MLSKLLAAHRDEILARTRLRVGEKSRPTASSAELTHLLVFLDQLDEVLQRSASHQAVNRAEIQESGGRYGHELFDKGLTVAQIVHDYAELCKVVIELAVERGVNISAEDLSALNLCLDDAIAGAVTEYTRELERATASKGTERLGVLADEMRNQLTPAMLAFAEIRNGTVAPGGSTAMVVARNLTLLLRLIESSLVGVRLDASTPPATTP
jgi:hypothetical protein